MSDDKSTPELEEILATIRRIIAEDEHAVPRSGGAADSAAASPAAPANDAMEPLRVKDDVLELTAAINDDGSVRHLAPIGSPSSPPASMAAAEPPPAAVAAAPESEPAAASDQHLVSGTAADAVATALSRVAAAPHVRQEPPMIGDRLLEDVVRDLLRPLLQNWLDDNLPRIVERLVEAEIARLSRHSGPA